MLVYTLMLASSLPLPPPGWIIMCTAQQLLTPSQLWLLGVSELGVPVWGFEFCVILMIILPQAITLLNGFIFEI